MLASKLQIKGEYNEVQLLIILGNIFTKKKYIY